MFLLLNLILFVFLTFSLVFILNKIVFSYIPVFQQNFILNTFILIPLSLYFSSVLYFFNLILFENSTVSLIFLEISFQFFPEAGLWLFSSRRLFPNARPLLGTCRAPLRGLSGACFWKELGINFQNSFQEK